MSRNLWIVAGVGICCIALAVAAGCSSGGSAGNIAKQMSDRLSDNLDFENGETKNGAPPSPSADGPAIATISIPTTLQLGQTFSVNITSQYAGASPVAGAVVYVKNAGKHLVVTTELTNGSLDLLGALGNDEKLRGENFTVQIALKTAAGLVGPYKDISLGILDLAALKPMTDALSLGEGGSTHTSDKPEGQSGDNAPQIESLDAPEFLSPGVNFELTAYTSFNTGNYPMFFIISLPGSSSWFEVAATVTSTDQTKKSAHFRVFATLTMPDLGLEQSLMFTYMVALRSGSSTGLYRAWNATIGASCNPGDNPVEEVWCDANNRLCWQNPVTNTVSTLYVARTYCENLVWNGHSDWRLPSIDELRTIIAGCQNTASQGSCGVTSLCGMMYQCDTANCGGCAANQGPGGCGCYWPTALKGSCGVAWSDTYRQLENTILGWTVDFTTAAIAEYDRTQTFQARCVRGMEDQSEGEDGDYESEEEEQDGLSEQADTESPISDGDSADGTSCEPYTKTCEGNQLKTCSASGVWANDTDCAALGKVCKNGECVTETVATCGCICDGEGVCTASPDGSTFTSSGCDGWDDDEECSGFRSVFCATQCGQDSQCFMECHDSFIGDDPIMFNNGESFTGFDCSITIHCPGSAAP